MSNSPYYSDACVGKLHTFINIHINILLIADWCALPIWFGFDDDVILTRPFMQLRQGLHLGARYMYTEW